MKEKTTCMPTSCCEIFGIRFDTERKDWNNEKDYVSTSMVVKIGKKQSKPNEYVQCLEISFH
jgi:hypothetical protein